MSDDLPCHTKPRDRDGPSGFMGHTCVQRFVTPGTLPTEHERELLTIFIEERAEVQQACDQDPALWTR